MARNSWYTFRTTGAQSPNLFNVIKFDKDQEYEETYQLAKEGNSFVCTCPAGHKWCRHKQMFLIFQAEQRIDSGYLYNFDKKLWQEPIQLD